MSERQGGEGPSRHRPYRTLWLGNGLLDAILCMGENTNGF